MAAELHLKANERPLIEANISGKDEHWQERISLMQVDAAADNKSATERFLLIKAFGAGFWCDLDHVVGGLLIAETAGRIPVVYWGKNSLYGGSDEVNAFEQFFLPVSEYTVHDLMRPDYTFCPGIWNVNNLVSEESPQLLRTLWHTFDALCARTEEVLVIGLAPLWLIQTWVQKTHPALRSGPEAIYRYIFEKYIKLQPHVIWEIDNFYHTKMKNRSNLAVHVRGSDKIIEVDSLHQLNKLYYTEIKKHFERNPSASIFLLTESEKILNEYKILFEERLIYAECQRTSDDTPVFDKSTKKIRMGIEVLKDTYLAMRCDSFIGNAHSNVSNAVARLKQWPAGSIKLFSVNDL